MHKQTFSLIPMLLVSALFFAQFEKKVSANSFQLQRLNSSLDWFGLLETQTELEVLYAFDTCGEQKKVLLKYFNEMPNNQKIKFKVTLKYAGYVIQEEKTRSVAPNEIIAGNCSMTDESMFIPIPSQWEFERVTVSADLIEIIKQ